MKRSHSVCLGLLLAGFASGGAAAQSFEAGVAPLVETSCMTCHGARTATPLDIASLGHDLTDRATFRAWERIYERVENGEMPPRGVRRPDAAVVETALGSLKRALVDANLAARNGPRTPLRRLTRLEYAYTIQDLLGVDEAVGLDLSQGLPAEADSGGFDTVAANQSMSPLHVRAYLEAADGALDAAIRTDPRPERTEHRIEYVNSGYLPIIENAEALGLGIVKKLDDAFVAFFDFGSTYTFHSATEGFLTALPGRYRVTVDAYPYQAETPVTAMVYRGKMAGVAASLDELMGTFDLTGPRAVEFTPYLRPGDLIGLSVADLDVPPEAASFLALDDPSKGYGGMKDYPGEGIAFRSLTIDGPLLESDAWPPARTRQLLVGIEFDDFGGVRLTKAPYEHVVDIVARFAPRAFRRPLEDGELEAYASLAEPLLAEGRPFIEAVRVPLRAILSAPAFLYQMGDAGPLDDFALASRLSYFLWRSMPDARLFDAARSGRLSNPAVLAGHVDRMLDDAKANRFVRDFAGQAFRLYELRATSPDAGLYPEYDDRLGQAMAQETELFLGELVAENRGADHLVAADFTFVNRRLAEHYGLSGVAGQHAPGGPARGQLPRGADDARQRAQGDRERDDDLAGAARQLRARQPARKAPGPARHRGARAGHPRNDDDSRAADGAPLEPRLRELPPVHRPSRLRARVVRSDRRLPDQLPGNGRSGHLRWLHGTPAVHRGPAGRPERRHAGRRRLREHRAVQGAACETPGAGGLAQSSILLVNTHSPWIADWMPAPEDRRHAERWK